MINTHYGVDEKFVDYPLKVVNGEILACEAIKLACKRYLSWFDRDDIYFDEDKADKPVRFIAKLKLTESPFTGQPFILLPWQSFLMHGIFGWYKKSTKTRLIQTVFCMVPRKSGKSNLAAAISLYALMCDGENGAEVDFVAPTRDQAKICLTAATNFAQSINKGNILKINRAEIRFPYTKSIMKTFSSDSKHGDGYNPSCAVIDETEILKDSSIPDILTSGQGMRRNPLLIQILTAGFDLYGYAKPYYDMCKDVLNGIKTDDSLFPVIYELDEGDDWKDKTIWKKASPSLGETVRIDAIEKEFVKASNLTSQEVNFKTKFLNMWCSSNSIWIPDQYIFKAMKPFKFSDLPNSSYAYVGIDLGSNSDLTVVSLMCESKGKYYFKTWCFLAEEAVGYSSNAALYRQWIRDGFLITTPGNATDYNYIIAKLKEIDKEIPIQKICYDSWASQGWVNMCVDEGLPMIPYSQKLGNFSGPTREIERQILIGNAVIHPNTLVRWAFGNVALKEDHNNNVKPVKSGNSNGKIDPVITMIQALGGYLYDHHISPSMTVI